MQSSEHKLFFIDHHVIAQIIKPELIIGHIGNITVIGFPALLGLHIIEYAANLKAKKLMHLSHPLRVTLRQIVVDRNHVDTFTLQRVQISRQKTGLRLTFTGSHLRDTSLMQNNAAD